MDVDTHESPLAHYKSLPDQYEMRHDPAGAEQTFIDANKRTWKGERLSEEGLAAMQTVFEARGATPDQAASQVLLKDRYRINTFTTNEGRVGMYLRSTNQGTLEQALSEVPELDPTVTAYLETALEAHSDPEFDNDQIQGMDVDDKGHVTGTGTRYPITIYGPRHQA
jgi:hypothetical protein